MSKYTTQVRFICEQKSGLRESTGQADIDTVIDNSWSKIFTSKAEMFDENYRAMICKKILRHFYLREIGFETVGVWQYYLNTRFAEMLPYYNQLWKSARLEFEPFYDVDVTRQHNLSKTDNGTDTYTKDNKRDGTKDSTVKDVTGDNANGTSSTSSETGNTRKDLYSDTPQGALTGVDAETYLTNARKVTDSGTAASTGSYTDNRDITKNITSKDTDKETGNEQYSGTKQNDTAETFEETLKGKQGGKNYSEMLQDYRNTFLNIDLMFINEFDDLFMNLW